MIDRQPIRLAFRKRLQLNEDLRWLLDAGQFATENRDFTPPSVEIPRPSWIRETMVWGTEIRIANNLLEMISVARYDVHHPYGRGVEVPEKLAQAIGNLFRPGTSSGDMMESGIQICVQRTWTMVGREASINDKAWFQAPVNVQFRAYAPNLE
jgi:hypothetical protein